MNLSQYIADIKQFIQVRRPLIAIIIAVCIIIIFSLFHSFIHSQKTKETQVVSVSAGSTVQKDVVITADALGTVQAYSTVNVKSLVDGQLLSVGFREGDVVQDHQLLFSIDPRPYQIQLAQAEANLARDQAQLVTAQSAYRRNATLAAKGYIAKQDFDQLKNNRVALQATVKADEAAIENAKLQLSYTTIYAPLTGRTGNLLVQPGNLVKSTSTDPLVVINQVAPIYVVFNLPEEKLPAIQKAFANGKAPVPVWISIDKREKNFSLQGSLTFIDNKVDTSTGTIQFKATFPNTHQQLWPGQYVAVKIPIQHLNNALLVPTQAVQAGPHGNYTFVIHTDNKVSMRPVKVGPTAAGHVVIEKGLQAGEKVVTAGQLRLQNGSKIRIVDELLQ